MMNDFAKFFIFTGLVFLGVGGLILILGKLPGFGRLPGDILIKKENFTFYFPLSTCIFLSILLSFILFFFNKK